ncbi:MAG TPA: hypothetical protein VK742_10750 [Candidatus Sulfotelmatobacter sp.]|jgi:hypothetical protein|nr:hypothetical protein [Candidatus Sulfotelmatobacter sp.]
MSVAFPLILTFSLGEKEQQLHISAFAQAIRAADWFHGEGENYRKPMATTYLKPL